MGNPIEEPKDNTSVTDNSASATNSHFNSDKIIKTIQIDHKGYYNVVDGAASGGSQGGSSSDTSSTGYGFDVHLVTGAQVSSDEPYELTFPANFEPSLTILYYHPHSSSMMFDSTFYSETVSDSVPTHMVIFGVTPLNTVHSEAPIIGNIIAISDLESIANEYGFTSNSFSLVLSSDYVGRRVNGETICDEYALYFKDDDNMMYNIFLNIPTVVNKLDYTGVFEPFIIESDGGNRSYQFDLNLFMGSIVVDQSTNTPSVKIEALQIVPIVFPIPAASDTVIDDSPTS